MRTRTNVNYGCGIEKGVEIFKNYYPGGNVNIVYEELSEAEELCKELTAAGYKADLRPVSRPEFTSFGFVIGLGSERAIDAAKRLAVKKFAFFPSVVCPDMLSPYKGKFAEFCYIDSAKINTSDIKTVNEIHAALFSVLTDAVSICYLDMGSPYCDKGLLGIVKRLKSILFGEIDIDDYVKDSIRTMENALVRMAERGINNLLSARMGLRLGGELSDKVAAAYFLSRLLILFTKWNFRDMLIPSEKTVRGVRTDAMPTYGSGELLLTEADLKRIAAKVKSYIEKPSLKRLVGAMKAEIDDENPLFAEIYNRGIPEGLVDYG